MQNERPGKTIQTTALVHEAYQKLIDISNVDWQHRAHFFAIAAQVMRRILLDAARKRGEPAPPLADVPFAVKNLFDVTGMPTLAGAKINRDAPPASRDATLIARLEAPAPFLSARSRWANTPTISPARMYTTARPATPTTSRI